jgi:hypothetical protein
VKGDVNNIGETDGGDTVTDIGGSTMVKYFLTNETINTVNSFLNKLAYDARILGKGKYPLQTYV